MGDLEIEIARKVGDTQVLFGSVTTSDIAAALLAKGFEIDRRKLVLARADQEARRTTTCR